VKVQSDKYEALRRSYDEIKASGLQGFDCDCLKNIPEDIEKLEKMCRIKYQKLSPEALDSKITRAKRHFIEKAKHEDIDQNPKASMQERRRMRKILNK